MREGVPATQGYLVLTYLEGKHWPREKPNGSQR